MKYTLFLLLLLVLWCWWVKRHHKATERFHVDQAHWFQKRIGHMDWINEKLRLRATPDNICRTSKPQFASLSVPNITPVDAKTSGLIFIYVIRWPENPRGRHNRNWCDSVLRLRAHQVILKNGTGSERAPHCMPDAILEQWVSSLCAKNGLLGGLLSCWNISLWTVSYL